MMKNKALKSKVLIVGLDGATFDIICPMIEKGQLPTISHLMKTGTHGVLKSTIPDLSPVAWTSMITGKKPGSHAIFDFISRQPDSYRFAPTRGGDRRVKPIWSLLSENGKKVGVINVTMSYPPEKVNGFFVSGIDTPGLESTFTYPPSLYNEIKEKLGQYVLVNPYALTTREKHLKGMFEMIDNRLATTKYLMERYEWDFLMAVFIATDGVQHFYWKDMDNSHPDHERETPEYFKRAVFDVYERLDEGIAELLALQDENITVMLVSDHGFHALHKLFVLNNWLLENGYLTLKKGLIISPYFEKVKSFGQILRAKLKHGARKGTHMSMPSQSVDWQKARAFADGAFGYVYINVKGRYPQGVVEPGREYDELCKEIMEGLKSVRDPDNGNLVVEDVFKREEVFNGPYSNNAPDLVVTSSKNYFVSASSKRLPRMRGNKIESNSIFQKHVWSGNHRGEGIFIINGPNIKKGHEIRGARIIDITPTILHLLEQGIPEDMNGKVLLDAFNSEYRKSNPPLYKGIDISNSHDMSCRDSQSVNDEDEAVKERLRNLGYLE